MIAGGADHDFPSWTIDNTGKVIHQAGRIRGGQGSVFNNTGIWLEQADTQLNVDYGGGGTLANAGTFRKTGGTNSTAFSNGMAFNNSGLLDVQTGTIQLAAGGSGNGTYSAAANAAFLVAADYSFKDGAAFTGPGSFLLTAGTITFSGTVTVQNLNLAGARLIGAGTVNLTGTNTWSRGVLNGSGLVVVPSGSTFYISSGADHDLPSATLNNNGTVIHDGGRIRGGGGAAINNTGLWLEQADYDFNDDYGGAAKFVNTGTFRKTAGPNATTFAGGFVFQNSGLMDVQSGVVRLGGGGSSTGTFNSASVKS